LLEILRVTPSRRSFSQNTLDWFDKGEMLENRPDQAAYQPFVRVAARTKIAAVGALIAALAAAAWLVSLS
jgi:hypothetical protein